MPDFFPSVTGGGKSLCYDLECFLTTNKDDYRILEFGADYVLGVHTTELGVQHVAMYDLVRPAATEGVLTGFAAAVGQLPPDVIGLDRTDGFLTRDP